MTLLRSIALIFALLAQAWPVHAMLRVNEPASCGMGCCAALAETEMSACGCAEPATPAAPANAPPVGGRELVPQVVWASAEEARPAMRSPRSLNEGVPPAAERDPSSLPHVRLAVLFCSFLN
ncbi:MAG: hypothetical protein Q8M07_29205 [Prosthecobacter sp.]|nr:hypothetical protein [Prosthecobacter sp.]